LATLLGQAPESLVSGVASTPALIDLDANDDIRAIRRVRFKLQAGVQGYAIELDDGQGPPIFFRRDWIESRGFRADKLLAVRVAGSSMEPTLYDGDLVVINTDDTSPKDGEPYGVWYEGEPGIKRLRRDQGEWWMYSDNQDQRRYAPRRCNGDTTLIGRVVYRQTERI
jgi:phage repressor protein C with HTH and peptisase S24 domain